MNNELMILDERELLGKEFKIYGTKEEPLFLAKDVAEWIEHSDRNKMIRTIDEEEKLLGTLFVAGQNRQMWFLTEDGLYEVLMQSRKPIAKQFKKEVKKILKQIRQTGGYIPMEEGMSDDEFMARALIVAQNTINRKNQIIAQQSQQLIEQQPMVEGYAQFMDADGYINMDNAARIVGVGRNTLYKKLRDLGILRENRYYQNGTMKNGENHNMPYQQYMKYFKVKILPPKNGRIDKKLFVVPTGMDFIRRKLQ